MNCTRPENFGELGAAVKAVFGVAAKVSDLPFNEADIEEEENDSLEGNVIYNDIMEMTGTAVSDVTSNVSDVSAAWFGSTIGGAYSK